MPWGPTEQFIFYSLIKIVAVIAILMPMIAYSTLAERLISAWIQDRVGPNRVGPMGLWQPLVDGVKSFLKEDFTPAHVRKFYFWLAPAITMIPAMLTIAVIPFGSNLGGQQMVIADLNVGILYTFGIVSLDPRPHELLGVHRRAEFQLLEHPGEGRRERGVALVEVLHRVTNGLAQGQAFERVPERK